MRSLMLQRAMGKEMLLVDLGPIRSEATDGRVDAVQHLGVGRGNFRVEMAQRLLVRLPPRKAARALATLPIVEGRTYWQTTHHWWGLGQGEEEGSHD